MNTEKIILITSLAWGSIEVTVGGETLHFKDCKIWPGGARAWNWRETGTEHSPGIQPADIEEILQKGAEVVVLARGMLNRLEVQPETETWLRERRLEYYIEDTKQAVERYNKLARQGRRVGGLFHTTC